MKIFANGRRMHQASTRVSATFALVAAILGAAGFVCELRADYRMAPGDIVEVSVFGKAELARRGPIDIDGNFGLPLVGSVTLSGLSLAEAQHAIAAKLLARNMMQDASVAIHVSEYRPVFIRGDVAAPKSYPFLPGLTVRHAIAMAGGFGASTGNEAGDSKIDRRAEYLATRLEMSAVEAKLNRLRFELDGKGGEAEAGTLVLPSAHGDIEDSVTKLEALQLQSRQSHLDATLRTLKILSGFTDDQLIALEQQRKQSEESVSLQVDEVGKVRTMFGKGLTTSTRVTDEQRALAVLKTQLLGNIAQSAEARRLRAELDRKITETSDLRRTELLSMIQEATLTREKLRLRLAASARKLAGPGDAGIAQNGAGPALSIKIFRNDSGSSLHLEADEDTVLAPGDVVDIRFGLEPARNSATKSD